MRTKASIFALSAIALALGLCQPAQSAALLDFDRTQVAPANPLWFQDAIGLKLQPCTDGDINGPCAVVPAVLPQTVPIFQFAGAVAVFGGRAGSPKGVLAIGLDIIPPGDPVHPPGISNGILIKLTNFTPGIYTVTHPFGVTTVVVGINGTGLVDNTVGPAAAATALTGPFTNFLYFANGVPLTNPLFPGALYLGGGELLPGPIFGSPLGTNYFRIEGPGLPAGGVQVNDFQIVGKVFLPAATVPPRAISDFAGTYPGVGVNVDARANDMPVIPATLPGPTNDIALNPTTITPVGTATKLNYLDQVLLKVPPVATPGVQSFTYTIKDFAGRVTDPATVGIFVEDMKINGAGFRARTGKWMVGGAGNISDLKIVNAASTDFFTNLVGAQEVPANASTGYGKTTISMRTDPVLGPVIDYSLNFTGLAGVTVAHLHAGAIGVSGAPHVFLCSNLAPPVGVPVPPACPATAGTVSGTLSAANFVAGPAGSLVTTFAELGTAIASSGTYVNVHTAAYPTGEIRGQVGRNVVALRAGTTGPVLGAAAVQADGTWSFTGKLNLSPAAVATVRAESAVGNVATRNLQKR